MVLGSVTATSPFAVISKIPSSSTEPKRFLYARKNLISSLFLSKEITVSTMCSRALGPAMFPSFVTWHVMIRTESCSLTQPTSSFVQYLSWFTVPGIIPPSIEYTVWIESIITSRGFNSFKASRISSRRIVGIIWIFVQSTPRRFARALIWLEDSSPET